MKQSLTGCSCPRSGRPRARSHCGRALSNSSCPWIPPEPGRGTPRLEEPGALETRWQGAGPCLLGLGLLLHLGKGRDDLINVEHGLDVENHMGDVAGIAGKDLLLVQIAHCEPVVSTGVDAPHLEPTFFMPFLTISHMARACFILSAGSAADPSRQRDNLFSCSQQDGRPCWERGMHIRIVLSMPGLRLQTKGFAFLGLLFVTAGR